MNSVSLDAPAKVNLVLRVLAAERSGYHGIETLFCRIGLSDRVTAERREGTAVTIDAGGVELGPAEDNLAVRAADVVLQATGRRFGVHLTLEKRIPVAAGLGGGSADAAATLAAVNQLAGGAIPRAELLHLAARLGADVPFLLSGARLALGWGHGERLLVLPALPSVPTLLLVPPVAVRTADAYRWIDEARPTAVGRGALALDLDALSRWSDIARMAGNDFESAVFGREPAIRAAFEALARTQPLLCRMSGSGSTLFAVYRTDRDRDDARMMLGKKHGITIATETA
ncbi:MAG: 4-(cytidine 5'-diphospho)-2-C-methyl-D-erythritol kinase [Gemmatimonadales bacterium]